MNAIEQGCLFPFYRRVRTEMPNQHPSHPVRAAAKRLREASRQSCSCIRSEEHTSELQSLRHLVCRLLLEKKKKQNLINKLLKYSNFSMYYNIFLLQNQITQNHAS